MINLADFIYKDGDQFYFDLECYNEGDHLYIDKSLRFQSGDNIKFFWEGKKMFGTLRYFGQDQELFVIVDVSCIE